MKTIKLFILLFVICIFNVNAQNYKSVFANDTTRWNIYECYPDGGGTFVYYAYSDTIISANTYKILYKAKLTLTNQIIGEFPVKWGYVREDLNSGKCWVIRDDQSNATESLLMDLSLQVGDYFPVYNNGFIVDSAIVHNAFVENNRRVVEINAYHGDCRNVYKTQFVEGVGSLSGFEEIGRFSLLCKYDNGSQVFSTQSNTDNNCFIDSYTGVNEPKSTDAAVLLPNPADDKLIIKMNSDGVHKLVLYNCSGVEVDRFESSSQEIVVDLLEYKAGIYLINIDSKVYKFYRK